MKKKKKVHMYICITFNMYNIYILYFIYCVWISFSAYLCTYMIMYIRKVVMNELLLTICICDPIYENPCIFGNRYFASVCSTYLRLCSVLISSQYCKYSYIRSFPVTRLDSKRIKHKLCTTIKITRI